MKISFDAISLQAERGAISVTLCVSQETPRGFKNAAIVEVFVDPSDSLEVIQQRALDALRGFASILAQQ